MSKISLDKAIEKGILLPDILRTCHLSKIFAISESGVCRLFRLGHLPGVKIGKSWIITRRALLEALEPNPANNKPTLLEDNHGPSDS